MSHQCNRAGGNYPPRAFGPPNIQDHQAQATPPPNLPGPTVPLTKKQNKANKGNSNVVKDQDKTLPSTK